MASYVEQATLRVNDQSTAQINKINAALKKLFATARSLKSTRVSLNVDARGLTAANKQLNTLARNIAVLRGQRLSLTVNDAGLAKARRDARQRGRRSMSMFVVALLVLYAHRVRYR